MAERRRAGRLPNIQAHVQFLPAVRAPTAGGQAPGFFRAGAGRLLDQRFPQSAGGSVLVRYQEVRQSSQDHQMDDAGIGHRSRSGYASHVLL